MNKFTGYFGRFLAKRSLPNGQEEVLIWSTTRVQAIHPADPTFPREFGQMLAALTNRLLAERQHAWPRIPSAKETIHSMYYSPITRLDMKKTYTGDHWENKRGRIIHHGIFSSCLEYIYAKDFLAIVTNPCCSDCSPYDVGIKLDHEIL